MLVSFYDDDSNGFLEGFDYEEDYGDPFVPYYEEISLEDSRQRKNFSRFLHNHISWMWSRSKGNTNVNWEFPTSEQWYGVASGMFELFCSPGKNEAIRRSSRMEAYVNVIRNVSKSICSMALPRALDKYEEGLRSHYLEEIHNLKLLQAMSVLSIHARGPCAVETAKSLQEECNFLWVSSRQQCEALSLSGKHCAKKVHCEDEPHSSHFVYHSTCNCGKTQGPRGDPFSLKEANIDFYSHLEESCCQDLQHWELPFKNPPSTSALLGSTEESEEDLLTISADVLDDDISSLSLSIGPNVLTEEESERNLLPELPHWSLILMGPSSKYSHSSGLNQPGFLGNYKHLLSWDIPITKTELPVLRERWPNLVETALKKMTLNSRGCGADLGVLAKVFFGCEYECSRGHRFIASSPSFKASKSSRGVSTRGWGAQVAGSDMPLYIPCSCSSRRSTSLGQLLRIHVVSPKAPLNVKLNPRIQPTEGGPIFLPGLSEPFKLPPNTYWILRLPFLYASKDAGVHLPPLFMENEAGKLFKGFITVTEDFEID